MDFYKSSKQIFSECGMNLRQFSSNIREFNENLPPEDKDESSLPKILGLRWDTIKDLIIIPGGEKIPNTVDNKREALSAIASVFDPLGLAGPTTVKGKMFIQKLWDAKLDWHESLPNELQTEWENIASNLQGVSQFVIPRSINVEDAESIELHGYTDASFVAYGACCYIRIANHDGTVATQLLFSKNRISPSNKKVSLPRKELLGILVGVRLLKFVSAEIKLKINQIYLWSDAEIALKWLTTEKELSIFVKNRVREITAEDNIIFRWVPTNLNPADKLSRSVDADELKNDNMWWLGPEFLKNTKDKWPKKNLDEITPEILEEINRETKHRINVSAATKESKDEENRGLERIIELDRFSSHFKLLKTTCYVFRFIAKFVWSKLSPQTKHKYSFLNKVLDENTAGSITSAEINTAEYSWEINIQSSAYANIISSSKNISNEHKKLASNLRLYQDTNGLIRSQGRVEKSGLNEYAVHPILLPTNSKYTELFVLSKHQQLNCASEATVLAAVRQTHWIPKGRSLIKRISKQCLKCRIYRNVPFKLPKMPQLPMERVNENRVFANCGVDLMGPFIVKTAAGNKKYWGCIFACMVVRAIRIQVVTDQSAAAFLRCLRRFIAQNGSPEKIFCDQGSNFKLANKALQVVPIYENDEVMSYCAKNRIEVQMNCPVAPYMGGHYERLIGCYKSALRHAIQKTLLEHDEFLTIILETEAVVNARPLTYLSNSNDYRIIRPIDFLNPGAQIGAPILRGADNDQAEYKGNSITKEALLQIWESTQLILDSFWKLWREEYLLSLREKHQLHHKGLRSEVARVPKIGEVVLVQESAERRGNWRIGRITAIIQSSDDLIRSAKVQLPNKIVLQRPIGLLVPLEFRDEENAETELNPTNDKIKKAEGRRSPPVTRSATKKALQNNVKK